MDVSIIIPSYNRLWSLPKAVESCRNTACQTEIIVIDDGSADGTWDWLQQQEGLVILKQENKGKCPAVNSGFEIAKGKYIKFLDSDDTITPGFIGKQFKTAERNGCDIVVSGYNLIDKNNSLLKQQGWLMCDDFIAQQLGECDSSHYSAFLFKKSFISDIPHRAEYAYRDDRMFMLEVALKSPKVAIEPGFALIHTQHTNTRLQNNTGAQQTLQNMQHLNIYKNILRRLQQSGQLTQRRIKAAINILWPLCHWIAKDDIDTAADVYKWIKELDPEFKIPDRGFLGLMYSSLGFKTTEKVLGLRRRIKYGAGN